MVQLNFRSHWLRRFYIPLKGPNGEQVKLNQSEINDEDELETGEEYSFFIYPNRSGELFATQNMPDITKDKYDFAKVLKQTEMVHV